MQQQKGFLMLVAVIIIVVFGILSAALVSMFIRTAASTQHLQAIAAAGALAESGLEQGKKNITEPIIANRQSCTNLSYTTSLTTGTANASRSQSTGNSINPRYSYSTLTTAIPSNSTPASIIVSDTSVFAPRGRVMIGHETFQYERITSATSLGNITQVQDGNIAMAHPIGSEVSQYQCTLSGTGSTGTANREYEQGAQQPIAYAIGANGTLLRWNSDTSELAWQTVNSGTTNTFKGISLQNYHSGWAVGNSTNGAVFNLARLQGNSWTPVGISDAAHAVNLNGVYATSSNEAWAVGDPASESLIIYNWVRNASNDNDNWCIMGINNCNNKTLSVNPTLLNSALYAIKTYDIDGDGYADRGFAAGVTAGSGGGQGGGHGNSGQGEEHCSEQGQSHGGCGGNFSEDGTGSTGGGIILYYSGTGWSPVTAAPLNYTLPSIIGQILDLDITPYGNNAPIEAFFVGRTSSSTSAVGIITRLRMSGGASWNTSNNNFSQVLKSVSVIDTNNDGFADFGCAVGNAGLVVTFDSNMNTTVTTLNAAINLNSVVVLSSTDIWVAGDSGARFHYNGTGWVQFNDGLTTNKLYGIAKVSSKNSPFSLWYELIN